MGRTHSTNLLFYFSIVILLKINILLFEIENKWI